MVSAEKFSMKMVYDCLEDSMAKVEWRYLMNRNPARPRDVISLWMCHGRHPTKDRLCRFGMIQEIMCSLCRAEDETMSHIFFACRITHPVWSHILSWLELCHTPCTWQDELKWIIDNTIKKG